MDIEGVGTSMADSNLPRSGPSSVESAIEVPTISISIWIHGLRLTIFIFTIAERKACSSLVYNFKGQFSIDVLLGWLAFCIAVLINS